MTSHTDNDKTTTPNDQLKGRRSAKYNQPLEGFTPELARDIRAELQMKKLELEVEKFGEAVEAKLGYRRQKVWKPDLTALRRLTRDIEKLPYNRRLRRDELKVWQKTVERLYKRQKRLETLIFEQGVRLRQQKHRQVMVWPVSEGGPGMVGDYLVLGEEARASLHAKALAKLRYIKHPDAREKLKQWAKKGAEARWAKARARQAVSQGEAPAAGQREQAGSTE